MKHMKIIITLMFTLKLSSLAETIKDQYFDSKEKCETACIALLSKAETESISVVFEPFIDAPTADPRVAMADMLINKSGSFECVQKLGEHRLGDLYFKQGYIIKFEKSAIFFEFVLLRSEKGYQPRLKSVLVKGKQSELLDEIPDYCWQ